MQQKTRAQLLKQSDLAVTDIALFENGADKVQLPQLVQAEINTLSLPYAVLNEKEAKSSPGHELIKFEKHGSNEVVWLWRVTPDRDHGMPTMLTMRVLFGIMEIVQEARQSSEPIPSRIFIGSLNSFCKRIGLAPHSKLRRLVREHIEILVYTTCKSKAAFKTKNGHGLDLDKFSYLRRARFVGQKDDDGNPIEQNFVELEDAFRRSLEANYIKSIDAAFMRQLKSPIAQLLYTHLSNLFSDMKGWPYVDPDYSWLAERMGLKVYTELKRARQQFKHAIAELIEFNYLAKAEWNGWKIRFYPGVRYTYGEAAPRLERKEKAQRMRRKKVHSSPIIKPIVVATTPEEDRETLLIRQATRLMLGQKLDEQLLQENDWTIDDVKSRMSELKSQR